jgi:putative pyoverdin transport system ATP-binding/permease protein
MIGRFGLAKYIGLGILSGLFGFLFITFLTRVVGLIIAGKYTTVSKEYVLIFILIIVSYIWIRKTLALSIIALSQKLLWNLRKQVLSLVLNANYNQLSGRKTQVRSTVFGDVYTLIDASMNIISFCTSLILAIACLVYLSTISWLLFLITLGIATIGAVVYHVSSAKNRAGFEAHRKLENRFHESFVDILDGFKTIFLEPRIGRKIYQEKIVIIGQESYKNSVKAFTGFMSNQVIGQILSYLLISSVLLFFSIYLKIPPADIVSFVFTLLYLLGAIEGVMVLLPGLMRARIAANNLMNLKNDLEEQHFNNPIPEKKYTKNEFQHIAARDLKFRYGNEEKSFGIGPVNFNIKKGESVFIYGGNGSGKTTFIHALLGICTPNEGEILLNDVPVTSENYPEYRTLFAVVFSDFYLFSELYAIDNFDEDRWNEYLRLFELEGKVKIENKRFSTTDLSTGQRKRLALIACLLEDKPVLVLDEWAADQDPYFRKKFYTVILPMLKEDDVTVIAITHDDKYYHCADKVYKMEYGQLVDENIYAEQERLIS